MAYLLDGFVNMMLSASGNELPVGPTIVKNLSIIQNEQNMTPLLQATVEDITGLHSQKNAFADGAPIVVNIGPGNGKSKPSTFRRFNLPDVKNGHNGDLVTFSAQLDVPKMRDVQNKSHKDMSSSDIMRKFAGELGLPFEGHTSDDKMTWLPTNRPLAQWLRHVADHGYAGAQSAMHLTMGGIGDGVWKLLYKDIVQQLKAPAIARMVSDGFSKTSDITIKACSWRSQSGTMNASGGYNGQTQQVDKTGKLNLFKQIDVAKSMLSLDINSIVKAAVADLPTFFLPMDTGNTHANFAKAKHQNERIKLTLTSFLDVLTMDYTNLKVLDPVDVLIMQGDKVNRVQSGRYLVKSRTQFVKGHNYGERIVLQSQGANAGSGLM